jgi:hypothetical protein
MPTPSAADAAILKDILEDYDYDVANLAKIREEADIDVAYAANDAWTRADKDARGGRPMLNLDQLSQYRNQVENTVRQNKRGVKISPAGNGATDQTAELRANRIREIEYQSHAQEAYSQAFSDCLTRSYGFARIIAEYEDEDSDNQVFRTKAIPNPNQVIWDSDGQSTSGRDWRRCVFVDSLSHAQFKRDYPSATLTDFDNADTIKAAGQWLTATRIQIAEAWRVHETPNPRGKGRPKREVCMYLTNGLELLAKAGEDKKHPWKGKYIPFGMCAGRVIYKGTSTGATEKLMLSYIRFARDGVKGYNWTKSTMLEKLALPVKASLLAYRGQANADTVAAIERASREHVPLLEFGATTEATGTAVLPLPQYGTREPDIQADLLAAEGFQRDIQNALGHFNAQDARLGNNKVTSGVALAELKRSGDLGSFDFQDHYDDFLKFLGEQYDDLLGHYDDAAKEVATRLPNDTVQMVTINTPTGRAVNGAPAYKDGEARMDQGRHTVSISTGPSSDSQRELAKETVLTLMGNPQLVPVVAAQGVRMMQLGPDGDQLAKDLESIQPPAMQQARQAAQQKDGKPADPRQLQQELGALKQQLQHAEAVMQQMDGELKGKQAELASREKIADQQSARAAVLAIKVQSMRDATALAVKKLDVLAKGILSDNEAQLEQIAIDHEAAIETVRLDHDREQAALDRQHQAEQAAAAQQHAVGMAGAGASAAADAQTAGHQQQLELGQQAADLAPVPEPTTE